MKKICLLITFVTCLLLSACASKTDEAYDNGYEKGYSAGYCDGAKEEGYSEGYSDGLYDIPEDFYNMNDLDEMVAKVRNYADDYGFNTSSDLMNDLQDSNPEIYTAIIDEYGVGNLPVEYYYYVLDRVNKVVHISNCIDVDSLDPMEVEYSEGINEYIEREYSICPKCKCDSRTAYEYAETIGLEY